MTTRTPKRPTAPRASVALDERESEERFSAPAVATAFRILDLLTERSGPTRLSEVTAELEIPKTTAMRVLQTMASLGVVRRDSASGAYQVGPRLLEYAYSLSGIEDVLSHEFQPIAEQVSRELNETIQLAVLDGVNVTFIAKVDSSRPVRLVTYVGRQLPAHATAVGKVVLAHEPDSVVRKVIDAGLTKVGPNTITDKRRFLAALTEIRRQGYATEVEESTVNLSCYSAPVFDALNRVVAGVTICIPTTEIPVRRRREMIAAVRDVANQVTESLRGDGVGGEAGDR